MAKRAVVALATGFEEIEAITQIDVLRRAKVEVEVAGVGASDALLIKGSRGVVVTADTKIESLNGTPDALILPGGMPGSANLAASYHVETLARTMHSMGALIAAICAAPAKTLGPWGLLDGKMATCYPGMEGEFSSKVTFTDDRVVADGHIVTSRGPGTALEMALTIVAMLVDAHTSDRLRREMVVAGR